MQHHPVGVSGQEIARPETGGARHLDKHETENGPCAPNFQFDPTTEVFYIFESLEMELMFRQKCESKRTEGQITLPDTGGTSV